MHWVRLADKYEVSGFGKVIRIPHGLHVVDAILLKQENTSFSTEIDAADMARALFQLKDEPGELSWWWHSHGHGNTFMSGTDHKQIENFGKHGWIAATVFNIWGDSFSAFYANDPFPHYIEDLDFQTIHLAPAEMQRTWSQDYHGKVRNFEVRHGRRGKRFRYEDKGAFQATPRLAEQSVDLGAIGALDWPDIGLGE